MENPGEELVGSYLREVMGCSFIQFNLNTKFIQGEIDVIGINYEKKTLHISEVATHLETWIYRFKEKKYTIISFILKSSKETCHKRCI